MSPNGHTFIREIADAYAALEREPRLHEDIKSLETQVESYATQVQRLELKLIDRNVEIDNLNAKVRSLEVERDDASFRELETQDKLDALKRMVGSFAADVGTTLKAMEPELPKPEPIAEVVQGIEPLHGEPMIETGPVLEHEWHGEPEQLQGQSVPFPSVEHNQSETIGGIGTSTVSSGEQGQSEANPTVSAYSPTQENALGQKAINASLDASMPAVSEPSGKYFGLRYADYPYYVSLPAWIAGGGTEANYYWRPTGLSADPLSSSM